MKYLHIIFFLAIVFVACTNNDSQPSTTAYQAELPFFNLKEYFQQEIDRFKSASPPILKKVTINGQSEEKQINNIDLEQELQVFIDADINKIAWFDKYQIDSTAENGILTQLRYTALDKDLKVKDITVDLNTQGVVNQIKINSNTESFVANSSQELTYQATKGYTIHTIQGVRMGESQDISVEILFR